MRESNCLACNGSGIIAFKRTMGERKNMPWSAACRCERGRYLSTPREWDAVNAALKKTHPPVVLEPIDLETYEGRIRDRRGDR